MVHDLQIVNVSTKKEVDINEDGSSYYVLDSVDWDVPTGKLQTYRVPYQIGTSLSGIKIGTRKPSVTGYIISRLTADDLKERTWDEYWNAQLEVIEQKKKELNKLINPFQNIRIYACGFYLEGTPTSPVKYSTKQKENNDILCKFSIDLECTDPMFKNASSESGTAFVTRKGAFVFPLRIKESGNVFGSITTKTVLNVENNGDCECGAIISIRNISEQIMGVRLKNVYTQEILDLTNIGIFKVGDVVKINTNAGQESIMLYGADGSQRNLISVMTEESTFLKFVQGVSVLSWELEGAKQGDVVAVYVEFEEKFFNIKEQ